MTHFEGSGRCAKCYTFVDRPIILRFEHYYAPTPLKADKFLFVCEDCVNEIYNWMTGEHDEES